MSKQRQTPPRRYNSTPSNKMEEALQIIERKEMSITKCSQHFGIAKGTLINKMHQRHGKAFGRPCIFTDAEEKLLVQAILTTSEWGFPLSGIEVQKLATNYLNKREKTKKQKLLSKDWLKGFFKRNNALLSKRMCQNLKTSKAKLTRTFIGEYFNNLKKTITFDNGEYISASYIFNYDETNLSDDPGSQKCFFKKGCKYPERVMDSSKTSISVMFSGSAAGELLPPYVVYKSEQLWEHWMEGGPKNTKYNRSKSGWFDATIFKDWFINHFIPCTRNLDGEIVLLGDNLSSHFSVDVVEAAVQNKIRFACFPPNSTHLLQPLDVAFFGPLKKTWRAILMKWKVSKSRTSQVLAKDKFPKMLKELVEKSLNENGLSTNLISGFKKCGIFPFDPQQVMTRMPREEYLEETATNLSSCVVDLLKEMRHGKEDSPGRKKRSKVRVTPGKGISVEELKGSPVQAEASLTRERPPSPSHIGTIFQTESQSDTNIEETLAEPLSTFSSIEDLIEAVLNTKNPF